MNDSYINDLINNIENTRIIKGQAKGEFSFEQGIQELVDFFSEHKKEGVHIFFAGNGGSSAIASHMTADFMKNGGMNTYSLYDNAVTTCMGNDYGYEYVFSKPLEFLGRKGDALVAISSSGNSQNIINAIKVAQRKEMKVITFTGFEPDNQCKQLGNINVYVASKRYGIVESIHNLILQQIVDLIMERDGVSL